MHDIPGAGGDRKVCGICVAVKRRVEGVVISASHIQKIVALRQISQRNLECRGIRVIAEPVCIVGIAERQAISNTETRSHGIR